MQFGFYIILPAIIRARTSPHPDASSASIIIVSYSQELDVKSEAFERVSQKPPFLGRNSQHVSESQISKRVEKTTFRRIGKGDTLFLFPHFTFKSSSSSSSGVLQPPLQFLSITESLMRAITVRPSCSVAVHAQYDERWIIREAQFLQFDIESCSGASVSTHKCFSMCHAILVGVVNRQKLDVRLPTTSALSTISRDGLCLDFVDEFYLLQLFVELLHGTSISIPFLPVFPSEFPIVHPVVDSPVSLPAFFTVSRKTSFRKFTSHGFSKFV